MIVGLLFLAIVLYLLRYHLMLMAGHWYSRQVGPMAMTEEDWPEE